MITELDRRKLQQQFIKETGLPILNSCEELDIYYVSWLEEKIINDSNTFRNISMTTNEII